MFLGIMVALAVTGAVFMFANIDNPKFSSPVRRDQWIARHAGFLLFVVGLFGAIGWITEVCL